MTCPSPHSAGLVAPSNYICTIPLYQEPFRWIHRQQLGVSGCPLTVLLDVSTLLCMNTKAKFNQSNSALGYKILWGITMLIVRKAWRFLYTPSKLCGAIIYSNYILLSSSGTTSLNPPIPS